MDSYEINHLQNKRIAEAVRKLNDYPKEDFNKQNTIIEKPSSIKSLQIISDQVKEPIIHIAEDESPKVNPKDVNSEKSLLEIVKQMKPIENFSSNNMQITEGKKNIYPVNYTNNLNNYEDILKTIKQIKPEEYNSLNNTQSIEDENTYSVNYTNNIINDYQDVLHKVDSCLSTSSFEDEYNINI